MKTLRSAYTLLELILALALAVLLTSLVGFLLQIYFQTAENSNDDIKQAQLARSILQMIADDLRSVVRYEPFDTAALTEALTGAAGGGGAGGGGGGGGPPGGGASSGGGAGGSPGTGGQSGAPSGSSSPSGQSNSGSGSGGSSGSLASQGGSASATAGGSDSSSPTSLSTSTEPPPLPGLYGSQYELLIDVSRLPRPDQYYRQQANIMEISLQDIPSDIKSVCYYLQASGTVDGVRDPLTSSSLSGVAPSNLNSLASGNSTPGGLVRRQLDRAITQYATSQGQSARLRSTGELVAPEVVSLEFAYFDGMQWVYSWDSAQQQLPRAVRISIAMQTTRQSNQNPIPAGTNVVSLTAEQQSQYGLRIHSLTVALPGAQLIPAQSAESQDTSSLGIP